MLGHATEKLTPVSYSRLFKYQVRVSQVVLIVSLILLVTGPVLSIDITGIHGRMMISGLVLFYLSVMYSQHVGFTRLMPSRPVSLIIGILAISWSLMYILNQWVWKILLVSWVLLYILLFVERGIGKIPLFYPNSFTVIGLVSALTAVATNNPLSLLGFPLSSLTSLMRRVEDRRRPSPLDFFFYAIPALMYFINYPYSITLLALFELMALGIPSSLPKRTGLSMAYPVGAALGRFGLALTLAASMYATPLDALHMLLIGYIAVMMSSLCIPMLIPGYLWLWPRGYGFEIPILIEGAALLRFAYLYTGSWAIYASLIFLYIAFIDILIHYITGRRIHVEI